MTTKPLRAALYCRVGTTDQTTENQRLELQRYADARNWTITEYLDEGISGTKERRPALDRLMADARRRHIDVVLVWRLDRLGRNLKHLITVLDELAAVGIAFVSLNEGLDWTTPAGRLQAQLLAMIAEFERERIREKISAGLARARKQGQRLGRRRQRIAPEALQRVAGLSVREAAKVLGVPASRVHRERERIEAID